MTSWKEKSFSFLLFLNPPHLIFYNKNVLEINMGDALQEESSLQDHCSANGISSPAELFAKNGGCKHF